MNVIIKDETMHIVRLMFCERRKCLLFGFPSRIPTVLGQYTVSNYDTFNARGFHLSAIPASGINEHVEDQPSFREIQRHAILEHSWQRTI